MVAGARYIVGASDAAAMLQLQRLLLHPNTKFVSVVVAGARYIVGASDAAAVFASVGVSYWTNRSFKQPLLLSACCCLAGNLLYCLRYCLWYCIRYCFGYCSRCCARWFGFGHAQQNL